MKITAPLLLLPLLLAACGTQSTTPAPQSSLLGNSVRATGPTYVEAFEAGVQRDLTALGLSGSINAQATAPKSYLNVLKVSDTTARAYMKTTYPAATGCALDWGDATAMSTITTPSVVATDKADHTYTQSGTYTIKLTCGTDIKTSTFTAVVPITNLNLFEGFTPTSWDQYGNGAEAKNIPSQYEEAGFSFTSSATWMVRGFNQPTNHIAIILRCDNNVVGSFQTSDGSLFDITTITGSSFVTKDPVTVTAYGAKGEVIGSTVFTNEGFYAKSPFEAHTVNWKNVKTVKNTCASFGYLALDDMSATVQQNPQ